jgi:hypothetical protein
MFLGSVVEMRRNIPPSIHSSSQKNFKLCLSTGLPTKAPHILTKKSYRLSFGSMVEVFAAECLNAWTMMPHVMLLKGAPSSRSFPFSSKTLTCSSQVCVVVLVTLARSRIGLCSVP